MALTSLVARTASLVRRLPARVRLAWLAVAIAHALERVGIVAGVLALTLGDRWAAGAIAVGVSALAVMRGATRSSVSRRSRAIIVDSTVEAILHGQILGSSTEDDLLVTAHEGLVLGPELVADQSPAVLGDLMAAPLVAIVLVLEAPSRALIVGAVAVTVAIAAAITVRRFTAPLVEATHAAFEPVYGDIAGAAGGRLDIVASGRDADFRGVLSEHLATWQRVAWRSENLVALARRGPAAAAVLVVASAIAFDATLRGAAPGSMFSAAALGASAAPLFLGLTRGTLDLMRTAIRLRPLFELLESDRSPCGAPGAPLPANLAPIVWRDVSFAYRAAGDNRPRLVVNGVTITWDPGQVLALRGPNGSGKSTLFRLLLGLAQPASGAITVGGIDVLQLDLPAWRRGVAYLPQRPYLAERATLRGAIRLLAPDADDQRMREALAAVGLSDPTGFSRSGDALDVRVGTLSAGQRQRLALARVLCQDSSVVILDEPDANLDADGIAMVERLVSDMCRDRMVAIVAHTPRLLKLADVEVELEDGTRRDSTAIEAVG